MREMKDSGIEWIGKIPHCWNTSKLKYLGQYINGYAFKPEEWGSKGVPIIRIQDLTGSNDNPNYFEGQIDKKYGVENGDILISWAATLDAFIWNKGNGWLNQHIFKAVPNRRIIDYDFFFWMIKESMKNMNNDNKHGIFMQHVTLSVFNNFTIPMPPLAEQERIAAFLDAECAEIDAVLEKTRASIEEYKKLKQAVITQAVTKGIRGDRPMKDSGIEWIGEIANEFAVYKFKYLLKTPMQYGANEAGITFDKTLPRYIRITDITSDGRLKQDNRLCIEDTVAKPYILQDGDLLFARSGGTVGKSFLYKQSYGNAAFAGYLIRAVVNRTIAVPEYVYYYTNSSIYDTWKNSIFIQSTIQNIGADRYSNMPIIVPNNIEEQRSIVEYLNERCVGIDALIRKKQQYLTEIENYKKSLIYEYVTGKKEVHPL